MGNLVRSMSNRDLLRVINKIKMEKQHPGVYGRHGTSRYVPESEFWRGHIGELRRELARRKRLGLIRASAGKARNRPSWLF